MTESAHGWAGLSSPARATLVLFLIALCGGMGLLVWWFFPNALPEERPSVFDINGAHPGDLRPGLRFTDNLNEYGIDYDLPYEVVTNTLGFRGNEPPKQGSPVVLILGDSFAFGMGVDTGKTYAEGLERALRAAYPNVIVHNAGVPGYTITDQLELWNEKLTELAPDLVLLCHTASDLKEMARPTSFRRVVRHDDEEECPEDPDVAQLIANEAGEKRAVLEKHYIVTQEQLLARLGTQKAPAILQGYLTAYMEAFQALDEAIRSSAGSPQFALVMWVDGYGMRGLTSQPLKEFARSRGIPVFDGDKAMRSGTSSSPAALFLPDGHFSEQGNALAAQQSATWVQQRGLLNTKPSSDSPSDH